MKQILKYLKIHLKEDFQASYYLAIAAFLAIAMSLNYYFDFEDSVLDSYYGKSIRLFYYFLFYCFAYYSATIIMAYFKNEWHIFKNKEYWIKSLLILTILAVDTAFHYHNILIKEFMDVALQYWASRVSKNLVNIFTTIIPLVLFYKYYDTQQKSFYGLTVKGFNHKPYLFILVVMIPLIALASFTDNFANHYPLYKNNSAYYALQSPKWVPAIIYELAYGWNFLTIELMFRGFMILALCSICGRNVVLPMVVTYCFYHFGKPEGEAISSIIGGYILGVIALESRSIFGGVLIHIGVAWLMEFFAWLQKL
ncbi:CPBP family intramembrane glutamic endopeptidase [Fulvivirga sediminis]|uniref:CPBP family intramembrane metalloprotease n=1 Tax=Fulvivirga sediminis TaxID=2803949 RepID=A0A937JZY1_9BACT|nr:CPBP family intramembrane glutamic endopeptidase [Fulvivirga sediminis]MBL3655765.1 CPBP family intramembrane metalloprotease [Fulvivirga sediminis]